MLKYVLRWPAHYPIRAPGKRVNVHFGICDVTKPGKSLLLSLKSYFCSRKCLPFLWTWQMLLILKQLYFSLTRFKEIKFHHSSYLRKIKGTNQHVHSDINSHPTMFWNITPAVAQLNRWKFSHNDITKLTFWDCFVNDIYRLKDRMLVAA